MSVFQTRENYPSFWEDRIKVRGQHVLWYSSLACSCMSDNGKIEPNCSRCFGKGYIYSPVINVRSIILGTIVNEKKIDISNRDILISSINSLTHNTSPIEIDSYNSTQIFLKNKVKRGTQFTLDVQSTLQRDYKGICTYDGKGLITVPIGVTSKQGYFQGQIYFISSIFNVTKNKPINVISFWANRITTNSEISQTDILDIECSYLVPVVFLLSGIDPKTKLDNSLLQEADMQMSFPGTYDIGRGDIIVQLRAELKETLVAINEGSTYKLPYFKIMKILNIQDKYGDISGYTLIRNNEILWGSYQPKRFSISFTYCPAYSVMDILPKLRYSEDKIYPKKIYLKKFAWFNIYRKVLENINPLEDGLIDDPLKEDEQNGLI